MPSHKPPFRILGIEHIGIVSKDTSLTKTFFENLLGLDFVGEEKVQHQATHVSMFSSGADSRLELLDPLSEKGPIFQYKQKKGSGIHHVALRVDDIDAAFQSLTERSCHLIGDQPSDGADGSRVFFVHPKSTGGILIELVFRPD